MSTIRIQTALLAAMVLCFLLAACQQTVPRDTPVIPLPNAELQWKTQNQNSGYIQAESIDWQNNQSVYLGGTGLARLWTPQVGTQHDYISTETSSGSSYTNYAARWNPNKDRLLSSYFIWQADAAANANIDTKPSGAIELDTGYVNPSKYPMAWNPDGTEVLVGIDCYRSPNDDPLSIYSASTGQRLRTLVQRTSYWDWYCNGQANWISPTRIIFGNYLIDAATGGRLDEVQALPNRQLRYADNEVSQNGLYVAHISSDTDGKVYLEWRDTQNFVLIGDVEIPYQTRKIRWLSNNTYLMLATEEGEFQVIDTVSKAVLVKTRLHPSSFYNFDFSPDLKTLISIWNNGAYAWDTTDFEHPETWEVINQIGSKEQPKHTANVYSLALQNNKTLFTTGRDGNIMQFNTKFGSVRNQSKISSQAVYALNYSSDGTSYATTGEDSTIHLWNASTQEETGTLNGHTYTIRALAWKPNSTTLASAGWDNTLRIWNTTTQTLETTQTDHTDYVNVVQYNPSGTALASASSDGTINLRNPDTGQTLHTLQPADSSSPVFTIAYNPNGSQLASGSEDHRVRIWNTATQTLETILKGHLGAIRSSVWLNSTTLSTGGMDGRIIIWDVPNQKMLLEIKPELGAVFSLTASSDGKTLYAGFDSGNVAAWKVSL